MIPLFFSVACPPPSEPENGGYRCRSPRCQSLIHGTVIEYFCDEGYALKGDYNFRTCINGEWDRPMQSSCRLVEGSSSQLNSVHYFLCFKSKYKKSRRFKPRFLFSDKEPSSPLGIPALSIVASTASSVALILLLVVLFVLVQPKLKSFHHNR